MSAWTQADRLCNTYTTRQGYALTQPSPEFTPVLGASCCSEVGVPDHNEIDVALHFAAIANRRDWDWIDHLLDEWLRVHA